MPILKRLTYALYILIATTMIAMLVLGIGEGIGLIRGVNMQSLIFHPLYFCAVYGVGFAVAPILQECLPIAGDSPHTKQGSKQPLSYGVRVVALAMLALVLALTANLIVYLLGKLT